MTEYITSDEQSNFETFRDCFSEPVLKALAKPIERSTKKKRISRKSKDGRNGGTKVKNVMKIRDTVTTEDEQTTAEDLGEFIDVTSSPLLLVLHRMRLTEWAVPLQHHFPVPPIRHPHALLLQLQRRFSSPRPLLDASIVIYFYFLDKHHPPFSPRLPNLLRPASLPTRSARPAPLLHAPAKLVRHRRHRAATHLVEHANQCLRAVRPGLDPADVSPSDTEEYARAGSEERLA